MTSTNAMREDTYAVTVSMADPKTGVLASLGVWDKMTGGMIDSDEAKYYPGGMATPVSLGGRKLTDNLIITRLSRLGRDHDIVQRMFDAVGKSRMVVSKQPLDVNANPYGRPIVYNGTLKRFVPPPVNSESSAAGLVEIEVTVDGFPTS